MSSTEARTELRLRVPAAEVLETRSDLGGAVVSRAAAMAKKDDLKIETSPSEIEALISRFERNELTPQDRTADEITLDEVERIAISEA